jgi:Rrf2 family transcriptional regulator, nitric oxide-sensitive transcriptional repressor
MRLTLFTDFGLRALMRLAAEPERSFTTEELASELAISRNHLVKIVRDLGAAGFVRTRRGKSGGFRLARAAGTVTIGQIVRRLEARQAMVECFRADGGACVLSPACKLRGYLAKAEEAFLRALDAVALSDCAYPRHSLMPPPKQADRAGS